MTQAQWNNAGATFRAARLEVGLSLTELAAAAGTTKSTLSRFERGGREISASLRTRVAQVIAAAASGRTAADIQGATG